MGSRPVLDEETDGMLDDFCEAHDEANRTKVVQKAVRLYIHTLIGRNEGVRERYVDLQMKRSKRRSECVADNPTETKTGQS